MKQTRAPWFTLAGLMTAAAAQAHEGHGLEGAHWHATDAWGWVALAAAAAALLWFLRRR